MIALTIYVFAAFGLAYIVGHSTITKSIREWMFNRGAESRWLIAAIVSRTFILMIECPACLGFHVGWIVGWRCDLGFVDAITLGFFTAGTNLVLGKITQIME